MAPPSKVGSKQPTPKTAKPPAPPVTHEQVKAAVGRFLEQPSHAAGWKALIALSERAGRVSVKESGDTQSVAIYEAVSKDFWAQYAKLSYERRAEVVTTVIANIGPKTGKLQREIVITAIGKGHDSVREKAIEAINRIRESEISSGRRDGELISMARERYAARLKDRCKEKDAPVKCNERMKTANFELKKYTSGLAMSWSWDGTNFRSLAGAGVDQSPYAFGFVADYFGPRTSLGRPIYGGRLRLGSSIYAASARLGYNLAPDEVNSINLFMDAGLFRIKGDERHRDDIPIEPVGLAPGGRAYAMVPVDVERRMFGISASLGLEYERFVSVDAGVSMIFGLSGGLYMGSVYDDGCAYSYESGASGVTAHSGGSSVTVSDPSQLSSRCRAASFSMGTALGATFFGLRKSWF